MIEVGKEKARGDGDKIDFWGSLPFLGLHLSCLLIFGVGFSWSAAGICLSLVFLRAFGLTAGYHRYFAHRSFKTSRSFQFLLGFLGAAAAQMGPLWWAGHHRVHHRHTDVPGDIHSPKVQGFFWAHMGWIMAKKNAGTNYKIIRDFARFPELRLLNRFHLVPVLLLGLFLFILGTWLGRAYPQTGTSGSQMVVWGALVSTTLLYHITFAVNSFGHVFGQRRFETSDTSRNSLWLALLTLGEGWHNNHHRFPSVEKHGYFWWEIDVTHYLLKLLSWLGIVWDLREPPPLAHARRKAF